MSLSRRAFCGALLSVMASVALAAGEPNRWTPAETLKYRLVSDPQVSPDGKSVAYVVRESIMESETSEYRTQIWLASTDGKDSLPLTFAQTSSSRPRWSPDGRWIAFLSKRTDKKTNLWLLSPRGGEARRLTDSKSDVSAHVWSPDGASLAYIAADAPTEEQERREKEKDDARVVDEEDRAGRLWVVSISPDPSGKSTPRKLVSGPFSVGGNIEGGGGDRLDWSPDGRAIAFVHTPRPTANDWTSADISLVDVAAGRVTPFAKTAAAESSPDFSPDGKTLAYLATDDPPRWARRVALRLAPAEGGAPRDLPASGDEQPDIAGWSADGKTIYFAETKGVYDLLYAQNVKTGAIAPLTKPGNVSSGASVNGRGTWIGWVGTSPTEPTEAYASALSAFSPVRVSDANRDLPDHPLPKTEVITWKGDKGETIEGLLTYPVGYEPGRRYPMILLVHGGPAGVFRATHPALPGPYPLAAFAAEGYAVLRPNPRGSSGYGVAFRRANFKDWGGGDYRDLMAGVEKAIAAGVADAEKLAVAGWSYGGFMTSWIITQTDRFQAASVGAGVTNLVSFTGTADIPAFLPDYFGGEPWDKDNFELYRSHSAMGHVQNVKTPTLIQHGESDVRVPISQGYELYNALKRRGVPAKMVVYPRMPHGPREPKLIKDLGERNLAWFNRYVLGKSSETAARQ